MTKTLLFMTRPFRYWLDRITYRAGDQAGALRSLHNKFAGQPMLVVGNGPSLNETPLDDFAEVPSIGMNKIDLLFPRTTWRPTIIVCTNTLVAKQHRDEFIRSEIPIYLSWKSRHFIPRRSRDRINYFLSLTQRAFSPDITVGVGCGATVTYAALQFAYYMGADPVIIFGVDHSYATKGKPHEIRRREGPDVDHFDPAYFKAGSFWGIPNLELSEMAYQATLHAFEQVGRKVYDATIGGKLEIFPKISVDRARELARR